jgi:hypothetical protein
MNATLFDGGKVHWLAGLAACCGVGKNRQPAHWQTDLGEITCRRCVKYRLANEKAEKVSTTKCEPHGQ